ncbi:MAG: hypothetical protein K9L31_03220 [Candidatus Pacebacteria bacterium]|nr:hypothetical protein [Candidatus Paceibacterota bacterium]
MTFVEFSNLIRYYTSTNSTTFSDSDILMLSNIFKNEMAGIISKDVNEDYFGIELERDLLADTRSYQLPSEMMSRIKYLQAKLNGENWERLNETDLATYHNTTDNATIKKVYAGLEPEFIIFNSSVLILSDSDIESVSNGLKLWSIVYPKDFVDLSSVEDLSTPPDEYTHGFPVSLHELLARRVSIAYKTGKDRPIPLSEKEQKFEYDLQKAIQSMKGANLDRAVISNVTYNDGSQY